NGIFSGASAGTSNWDSYMGRVDYLISPKDQVFGHYIFSLNTSLVNRGSTPTMFQNQRFPRQSVTLNETHTFSPTLLNSITATFDRVNTHIDDIPTFDWQALGAAIPPTIPNQEGWVNISVPGYFTATNGVPWRVIRNMYAVNDTLTWVKGRHTTKFGAQVG